MGEAWQDVIGFEGQYQVKNGRIRKLTEIEKLYRKCKIALKRQSKKQGGQNEKV